MKSWLMSLCVTVLLGTPVVWGQSSSDDSSSGSLADRQPAENVRGGTVRERAPGRVIEAARARHVALRDQRLAAQRSHETSGLAPEEAATAALSGSFSNLFGGAFSSLINTFLNSGVDGALGGQNGSGSTGSTGGSDFSNLPPEVLQMLADAGISLSDLNQKQKQDSVADSTSLTKASSRAQTNDAQEQQPRFVARWADAMLSTFFTAITVAFRTSDFINVLKDAFRPFFIPQDTSTDQSGSDGGSGGNQNSDSGDGGGGGGGGLI